MANPNDLIFLSLHPFVRSAVVDKIEGVILGAALGDCIGLYTEFLSKRISFDAYPSGKFQLVEPTTPLKIDGHRSEYCRYARVLRMEKIDCKTDISLHKSWTDDTDHALLIILSYLHHDGQLFPNDLAKRLRTWGEQGLRCLDRLPLGLGRTVGRVVFGKAYLDHPQIAAYNYWVSSEFNAAPNGSLMRTHPLGVICAGKSLNETFRIAIEFSIVTHADPRCVLACCISTALIRGILRGEVLTEQDVDIMIDIAFDYVYSWQNKGRKFEDHPPIGPDDEWVDASVKKYDGPEDEAELSSGNHDEREEQSAKPEPPLNRAELYQHVRAKTFQELQLDDSMRMGYVYKSLGAATVALRRAMNSGRYNLFENLITEIVMEGGDADTNACIAGAVLGAWVGYAALPSHWRDGMEHRDWMLRKSQELSYSIGITDKLEGYRGSEDLDAMEDGGRGFLDKKALEAREMAFMEMYLMKRAETSVAESKGKRWKVKLFSK